MSAGHGCWMKLAMHQQCTQSDSRSQAETYSGYTGRRQGSAVLSHAVPMVVKVLVFRPEITTFTAAFTKAGRGWVRGGGFESQGTCSKLLQRSAGSSFLRPSGV